MTVPLTFYQPMGVNDMRKEEIFDPANLSALLFALLTLYLMFSDTSSVGPL